MINLLSYDEKKQTRAARLNVILLRSIVILGFSLGFLILACGSTYLFIDNNKVATSTPSSTAQPSSIQKQVISIQGDFATAKGILDQQVNYSDAITGIAATLPTGTVLNSLTLNDSTFGATTNLQILARSDDIEPKIKAGFQNSSIMFSGYTLQSSSANKGNTSSEYPTVVNIGIIINKGAFQ